MTEMHRQVGELVFDEHGLARRGLPVLAEETEAILRWMGVTASLATRRGH